MVSLQSTQPMIKHKQPSIKKTDNKATTQPDNPIHTSVSIHVRLAQAPRLGELTRLDRD